MNILKETTELYRVQKERVEMDLEWERKMKKTFPSLNQDIRLLKEILSDLERRSSEVETTNVIPDSI